MKSSIQQLETKLLKQPFTYVVGAILLSVLQILLFASMHETWGITTAITNWGAGIMELIGMNVSDWNYFANVAQSIEAMFINGESLQNIGIIMGALLAALLASQFKIKKIKSKKQLLAAMIGGLLMGYGARLANGCNIGALYSSIAGFSLSGWVFAIFLFIGALIGSKLLIKYFS